MTSSSNINTFKNMSKFVNTNDYDSDNSENSSRSKNSTDSTDSISSSDSTDSIITNRSINYYRRKKWVKSRSSHSSHSPHSSHTSQILNKSNNCESCFVELGYTSKLSKDTPFIKYLIDKRINFCQLGASSHIAAFVPVTFNSRCCFIHNGKWKGRYR